MKVVRLYVSRAIETSQTLKNLFKDHNTFPLALWLHHSLCSGHAGQLPIFLCTSKFSFYGCYTGTLSPTTQFLHISAWFTTLLPSNLLKCHFLNEVYLTALFKTCKSPYSLITHPSPYPVFFSTASYFLTYIVARLSTRGHFVPLGTFGIIWRHKIITTWWGECHYLRVCTG